MRWINDEVGGLSVLVIAPPLPCAPVQSIPLRTRIHTPASWGERHATTTKNSLDAQSVSPISRRCSFGILGSFFHKNIAQSFSQTMLRPPASQVSWASQTIWMRCLPPWTFQPHPPRRPHKLQPRPRLQPPPQRQLGLPLQRQ